MATNDKSNTDFEKKLWSAACVLWEHIPAAHTPEIGTKYEYVKL